MYSFTLLFFHPIQVLVCPKILLCFGLFDNGHIFSLLILQDPRLLGEIHIALLRSIMKDIEYVARTPSTGLGAIQNNVANSGGGHPQVVEGVIFLFCIALDILSLFFTSLEKVHFFF